MLPTAGPWADDPGSRCGARSGTDLDDWFHGFLTAVLGSAPTGPSRTAEPLAPARREPEAASTARWLERGAALVEGQTEAQRERQRRRQGDLAAAIRTAAGEIGRDTLEATFGACAAITTRLHYPPSPGRDLVYLKINHGFWEQLYALLGEPDAGRMRIRDPERFRPAYLDSLFLEALLTALARGSRPHGDGVRVEGVELGLSLTNGASSHAQRREELRGQRPSHPLWTLQMGAAIGCVGTLRSLYGPRTLQAADGCFPRLGLLEGGLGRTLRACADQSDAVLHVVPPHLARLRLRGTDRPQHCLLIPARQVHESWVGALHDLLAVLLGRLAQGQRLLVLTQSAVFSALLGLVLAQARRDLIPESGRLFFLDLGQVLDLAAPERAGFWVRTRAAQPWIEREAADPLFHLGAEGGCGA